MVTSFGLLLFFKTKPQRIVMPKIKNLNHEEHEERPARKEVRKQESEFRMNKRFLQSQIRNLKSKM